MLLSEPETKALLNYPGWEEQGTRLDAQVAAGFWAWGSRGCLRTGRFAGASLLLRESHIPGLAHRAVGRCPCSPEDAGAQMRLQKQPFPCHKDVLLDGEQC